VTELALEPNCADIVFSNWLLMYLSDEEVANLARNILSWVSASSTFGLYRITAVKCFFFCYLIPFKSACSH
jgi:hypothetical protein